MAAIGSLAGDQSAPGKKLRLPGCQALQRIRQGPKWSAQWLDRAAILLYSLHGQGERVREPAQGGVGRHGAEQRLVLQQLSCGRAHVLDRSKQQSLVGPEGPAIRSLHRPKQSALRAEVRREARGSRLAQ